jgi:hypothetical protein
METRRTVSLSTIDQRRQLQFNGRTDVSSLSERLHFTWERTTKQRHTAHPPCHCTELAVQQ